MKKLFVVSLLVFGAVYGQDFRERFDGVTHERFQNYTKSSYTQGTANDTTGWTSIKGARSVGVFFTVTDTIKAVLKFQFKDSFTGYLTGWTITADSISGIGTSSALAYDRIHAFATSDTSITSYDLVRFYIDYVTYLGVSYTGGTLKIYTDIYKP